MYLSSPFFLMNFTTTKHIFVLFFVFFFTVSQATRFVELLYKFKYVEAKAEYDAHRGHFCVHDVKEIKDCALNNLTDESLNQEAFVNCVTGKGFHEILANEAAKIPVHLFENDIQVINEFNHAYTAALNNYVRALDAKYEGTRQKVPKLDFRFNWIPWVILLVAFGIVYGLNNRKMSSSETQPQESTDNSIYEKV